MTHVPPLLTKIPFQINEIPCYRYRLSRRYIGIYRSAIAVLSPITRITVGSSAITTYHVRHR